MEQRFRRITVTDQGIQKKAGWFLDRYSFDLSWDRVEGRAIVGAYLVRSSDQQVVRQFAQFLELHYEGGRLHSISHSDTGKRNFDRVVQMVQERLPGKRAKSFIEEAQERRRQQGS
ncbi:MAG TPA: hypothetical protein VK797_02620 [Tepidisphaeraceae bacterium]|jgi:hypothetical protein|nr:hypothetical protein [Tepidisphaeraceae bacterium]